MVSEEIYNLSKVNNVEIVVAEQPDLFAHDASPVQNYSRKVQMAHVELERDMIVKRTREGLEKRLDETCRKTQDGEPKVNGVSSTLEALAPTATQIRKIKDAGNLFLALRNMFLML